jgi:shikimate kinase
VNFQLTKSVVLIGMMGAGKTAVGAHLASVLDVPFVDCDTEIEQAANLQISEIFETYGEVFFREKETQVLTRLLDGPPGILSTGGGAFMLPENRSLIAQKGVSLWLNADLALLWTRVKHKTTRPLLNVKNPLGALTKLHNERVPIYNLAQLHVNADPDYSISEMSDKVIEGLCNSDPQILVRRE